MHRVRTITCAASALLCLYTASPATASTSTLADLLAGGTLQAGDLTFSNFSPLLAPNFLSGSAVLSALANDPGALGSMPLLAPQGGGVLSLAFGNATPAVASSITVESLSDDLSTLPIDPGLRFDGPTWSVTAGNIASLQLTGFFYDVTRAPSSGKLLSASLAQEAAKAVTVGPDRFPSAGWPDFALGSALQFVFDAQGNLLDGNATSDLFARFDFFGVVNFSELASDFAFLPQDAVRVYNLVAVGASSQGAYTLGRLTERYDPPFGPPGPSPTLPGSVPEPAAPALIAVALAAVALARRRPT